VLTFILTEQDGQEELQMIISLMILELEHRGLLVPLFSSSLARPSSKPGAMTQPCIAGRRQWRIGTATERRHAVVAARPRLKPSQVVHTHPRLNWLIRVDVDDCSCSNMSLIQNGNDCDLGIYSFSCGEEQTQKTCSFLALIQYFFKVIFWLMCWYVCSTVFQLVSCDISDSIDYIWVMILSVEHD
jgi:hypothetical protein